MADSPRGPGWSSVIDRGLRWMFVVPISVSVFFYLPVVLQEYRRVGALGRVGLLLIAVVQVAVVLGALRFGRSGERTLLARVLGVLCLAGLVLLLVGQPPGVWQIAWWPTTVVNSMLCFVLVFGGRHRWRTGIVLMLACLGVRLVAIVGSGESLRAGLAEGVSGLQLAWTVVLAVEALRAVGATVDASVTDRRRVLLDEELGRVQQRQTRAVERLLHDEVLHTLRVVARPGTIGVHPIREAAARTVALLTRSRQRTDQSLLTGLGELQREVAIRIDTVGQPPELPTPVESAFTGAIREAIRNADRHSGASTVRVHWRSAGPRVEVEISDDGRGFDASGTGGGPGRGGIVGSITEPMADVGGSAEIRSSGEGTRVLLGWRAPTPSTAVLAETWQAMRRGTVIAMIPILVGNVLMLALLAPDLERLAPAILGTLLVSLAGAATGWAIWRGTNPALLAVLAPLACLVGLFLNVLAIPAGTGNAFYFFLAGGVIPVLMPQLVVYPLTVGLAQTAAVWAGIVVAGWWRFGLARTMVAYAGAITAPTLLLAILILRLVVGVYGPRLLAELGRLDAAEVRTHEREVRNRVREARLRRVSQRIVPFLTGVATGRVALGAPTTERRARQLELEVRDEVQFGGPTPALANRLIAVRERGWLLELRLGTRDVAGLEQELLRLLVAFDREPWSDERVVVSNLGELVAVFAGDWVGPPPDARAVRLERGDGFCTLRPTPVGPGLSHDRMTGRGAEDG